MNTAKKTGLAGAQAAPTRKPLFPKDSPLAKHPLGQMMEAFRDVPAHKIKVWPLPARRR